MRIALRSLLVLLLGLSLALPLAAREEIRVFASDVVLNTDGSVAVTESIEVNAEGNEIRRGIYRDIPVVMLGSDGGKVRPDLDVIGVERDGSSEMFRVERMGNFQRIWIGNPDQFISRGLHRFVIRYTMTRMAREFEDHDELYWNATGNYWVFPILSARATVRLPNGAVISDLAGYTGSVGSAEQAVSIKKTSDTMATFRSSHALGPGEGMTIALAFNKGVVAYPTGLAALQQHIADLSEIIFPLLAALVAVAYNALAWFRVGRDPAKGVIIPLFHPPKGFSAPLVHYVHNWGFKNSGWVALTSAIFDLGVKGLVAIDNTAGKLRMTVTGKQPEEPLPSGEKVIFNYLSTNQSTTIDKATGPELKERLGDFVGAIANENRALWFRNNTGYSILGGVIGIGLLLALVLTETLEPEWLIAAMFGGVFGGVVIGALGRMLQGGGFLRFFTIFWIGVFAFNLSGVIIDTVSSLPINTGALAALSIVIVTVVFASLMRAPTLQGRKVMDQIDGLKLYIETAEKERMNITDAPPMTVDRFERILPYAIALGVEKPWSSHFEAELARHAVADAPAAYQPAWYHGSGSPGSAASSASGVTTAVSAAAARMTAAMVAAQPVQASSSGFSSGGGGGGGFSGGGGGGGGGGGW